MNNKGADQSAQMRRLVCACVCSQTPEDRFSRVDAHLLTFYRLRNCYHEVAPAECNYTKTDIEYYSNDAYKKYTGYMLPNCTGMTYFSQKLIP